MVAMRWHSMLSDVVVEVCVAMFAMLRTHLDRSTAWAICAPTFFSIRPASTFFLPPCPFPCLRAASGCVGGGCCGRHRPCAGRRQRRSCGRCSGGCGGGNGGRCDGGSGHGAGCERWWWCLLLGRGTAFLGISLARASSPLLDHSPFLLASSAVRHHFPCARCACCFHSSAFLCMSLRPARAVPCRSDKASPARIHPTPHRDVAHLRQGSPPRSLASCPSVVSLLLAAPGRLGRGLLGLLFSGFVPSGLVPWLAALSRLL